MTDTSKIIAATRSDSEFLCAVKSEVSRVFDLNPDIMNISAKLKKAHEEGKKLYIHLDLAKGIGKDESGLKYLKRIGVDGIISTKNNLIKLGREQGLSTVQRFFIVDSKSIDSATESFRSAKPDMIEIMPGTLPKVVKRLGELTEIPIIAGGLIETDEEVFFALESGAFAVSTGRRSLWTI